MSRRDEMRPPPSASWSRRARMALGASAFFAVSLAVGYATRHVDSPAGIVTWSGAFITDEGFHSKWAQNAARFGTYGDPFDFSFVPAGLLHNVATLLVFRAFGASFEVLRLYAAFLAALGLTLYWVLLGSAPERFSRWQTLVLLITTVNYAAYARVLFIEPLGVAFSLAALMLAIRSQAGWVACVLSVAFAFGAFLTKIHFLDIVCTVVALWLLQLTAWREPGRSGARGLGPALVCSTALMLLVAGSLFLLLQDSFSEFVSVTRAQFLGRDNAPYPLKLLASEANAFRDLLQNTHHAAFLASLLVAGAVLARSRPWRNLAHRTVLQHPAGWICARLRGLGGHRLDVAMALWLVLGVLLRGLSSYQAPRYFFPLLFPLSYLAVRLLLQSVDRHRNQAFLAVLLVHAYVQAPLYYRWLYRKDVGSQYSNHVSFVREIEARAPGGTVTLLGGDAAVYSLFSKRIRPIEPEYVPNRYTLCDRIKHWRPGFYVSTGTDDAVLSVLRRCPGVGAIDELKRESVFTGRWSYRILYAISQSE